MVAESVPAAERGVAEPARVAAAWAPVAVPAARDLMAAWEPDLESAPVPEERASESARVAEAAAPRPDRS
jgi:hypothetical protein